MARTTPIHAIELMDPPVKPRAVRRHKTHCAELRKWKLWTNYGGTGVIETIRKEHPDDVADALIARKKSRALHRTLDDAGMKEDKAKWEAKATNFVDDWDPTDWSAESLQDLLDELSAQYQAALWEFEQELAEREERSAAKRRLRELEAVDQFERQFPRPPKGIFSSKQEQKEEQEEEEDATVELMSDREYKLRLHVAWPSPAHKPRKPRPAPSNENPYGKPRFQERVGMGQFRSVDPVGLTGAVRVGRNRKVG